MAMAHMKLSRGSCIFCTNCNKIVSPPDASSITKLLPHILEGLIDSQKLDSVSFESLKICPSCLQDILFIVEHKSHIKDHSDTPNNCNVCFCDKNLVSVKCWNHFETIIENLLRVEKRNCYIICLKCMKYLETLDRIKTNFIINNPQLALKKSQKKKNTKGSSKNLHQTPNKKRQSTISHSNEVNHDGDLEKALRHLKPLQLLNFDFTDQFQKDEKLMNQIAFVKLQSLKAAHKHRNKMIGMPNNKGSLSVNNDHKLQSFFKIKFKMRPVKTKKITKMSQKKLQQSTSEFSSKELSVKLLKVDLNKLTQHSFSSTVKNGTALTPTKASLKLIEEPLSSSKKRKSVTFAPCLNEVLDDVIKKEENTAQSPIKSLLKRNFDLIEQEENGMVSKKQNIDNFEDSDDDDNNRLDPFTEHLKNNSDSIFESLKCNNVQNSNGSQNTVLDIDTQTASETIENCSSNKEFNISEQCENSEQNTSEIQVENKSDDINEANKVEMRCTTDVESPMNELKQADNSQDNQDNNEDQTKKRKLSDYLSVSLELDSDVEPEAKILKISEKETINSKEIESGVDKSDIINDEVIATIVLNSQEDTCNENGKIADISETDLDLPITEI